jgi:hypothetical protein
MPDQKSFQARHVCFAGLAQQPAGGFVYQVFGINEVLAREVIGGVEKVTTAGEGHERDKGSAAQPQ